MLAASVINNSLGSSPHDQKLVSEVDEIDVNSPQVGLFSEVLQAESANISEDTMNRPHAEFDESDLDSNPTEPSPEFAAIRVPERVQNGRAAQGDIAMETQSGPEIRVDGAVSNPGQSLTGSEILPGTELQTGPIQSRDIQPAQSDAGVIEGQGGRPDKPLALKGSSHGADVEGAGGAFPAKPDLSPTLRQMPRADEAQTHPMTQPSLQFGKARADISGRPEAISASLAEIDSSLETRLTFPTAARSQLKIESGAAADASPEKRHTAPPAKIAGTARVHTETGRGTSLQSTEPGWGGLASVCNGEGLLPETIVPIPNATPSTSHAAPTTVETLARMTTELPQRVVEQIAAQAANISDRPVELILAPEELGRVRLSLTAGDGGVAVQITTERAETQDLIRRHIDLLAQELRDIGYSEIAFEFGHRGDDGKAESDGAATADEIGDDTTVEQSPTPLRLSLGGESGLDIRL